MWRCGVRDGLTLFVALLSFYTVCAAVTVPGASLDPLARCVPLDSGLCAAYAPLPLGESIIVFNGSSPNTSVASAQVQLAQVSTLSLIAPNCLATLRAYVCVSILQPCYTLDTNTSLGVVALPKVPCNSSCLNMQDTCRATFTRLGLPLPPCPPELVYDFTAEGGNAVLGECVSWPGALRPDQACPVSYTFFGRKDTDSLRTAVTVISYISFILCVASAVLTALNPVVRKWPGGLIVFIAIGESFLAFAMLMGSFGSLTNFMCNPAPKWRNLCKLQGFLLVSGLHVVITAWLVTTALTSYIVWSSNPKAALLATQKYRWYLPIAGIVPVAFIAYCSRYLGATDGAVICALFDPKVLERGMVWPLLVELFLGTLCWLASVIATIRAVGCGSNGSRDLPIYARLLVYEMLAIVPSVLYIIPFEINRENLLGLNGFQPQFVTGGAFWRFIVLASLAPALAPVLFGVVFIARREHYTFIRRRVQNLSGSASGFQTTASGHTTASGSNNASGKQPSGNSGQYDDGAGETSRY